MSRHKFHAVFQPGIQLFRNVPFRMKAIIISIGFLIPLVFLSASYILAKREAIAVINSELFGLDYAKLAYPVMKQAQELRRYTLADAAAKTSSPELIQIKNELDSSLLALSQHHLVKEELAAMAPSLEKIASLQLAAAPSTGSFFEVFASHSKFNGAIRHFIVDIADTSGLSLDPEIDTYYLQNVAVAELTELRELAAKSWALTSAVARAGSGGEAAAIELAREEALIDYQLTKIKADIAKVVAEHPELEKQLDVTDVMKSIAALTDVASDDPANSGANGVKKIDAIGTKALAQIDSLQKDANQLLANLLVQRKTEIITRLVVVCAIVCAFVLAAIYLFVTFTVVVDGGLQNVSLNLKKIADGDLTEVMTIVGKDETAVLKESLQHMQQALVIIVTFMQDGSQQLASSINQVSESTADLAQRTADTVGHLQNASQAMAQIASTVESSSENAQQATKFAKDNAELATVGGKVIREMVQTMDEIQESSSRIGDIVSVIEGIAFQTNLLALNAAVEAARAGEAGRGFAVVASEVRALAQRSSGAARQIKQLIVNSIEKVASGNDTVKVAGQTMEEIVASAQKIATLLDDISISTKEEASAVKQVETTVKELDLTAQENARMVEETSNSIEDLNSLAHELLNKVSTFKLPASQIDFF